MKPENFGENLGIILKALGLSQADLALKSGLTKAAISQIVSGKREPSLSSIVAILNVVPIKFEKLVSNHAKA